MQTYVYKKVGALEIKAKVVRADDDVVRPLVVWIHGGALINGHRDAILAQVEEMMLGAGYALLSIDYRLAPETKLPEIVGDIEDAFEWARHEGPSKFQVNTDRIAVMGGSAGGCLTLLTGYRVKPRPTVLVSFWGYGDLVGDWYCEPSPHPRHHKITMSKDTAHQQVSGSPLSDARDRAGDGEAFYQYCRQHGAWPKAVSGWDPRVEVDRFSPYMAVNNVTPEYPPTLLIHGTEDTDVPHEQSMMMAEQFQQCGVEHELVSIAGGEHGLAGGAQGDIDAAYQKALAFVNRHMRC